MKKMKKSKIAVIAVLGIVAVALIIPQLNLTKNKTGLAADTIDLLNPFVKVEEVYGAIPDEPSSSWDDAATGKKDYAYIVKTYTKSGKARTVAVNAFGGKFDKNTKLLKIRTKGQSVRSYASVSETDVPEAALKEIKTK